MHCTIKTPNIVSIIGPVVTPKNKKLLRSVIQHTGCHSMRVARRWTWLRTTRGVNTCPSFSVEIKLVHIPQRRSPVMSSVNVHCVWSNRHCVTISWCWRCSSRANYGPFLFYYLFRFVVFVLSYMILLKKKTPINRLILLIHYIPQTQILIHSNLRKNASILINYPLLCYW